eukprot:1530378-Rhodomonas_salina.1
MALPRRTAPVSLCGHRLRTNIAYAATPSYPLPGTENTYATTLFARMLLRPAGVGQHQSLSVAIGSVSLDGPSPVPRMEHVT